MGVIYSIVNKINNATYIGSTIGNGYYRWVRHKTDLKANIHHSQYLQRAYNKYGKENFIYTILEHVENDNILIKEQEYLDDRKNNYLANLNYNVCWIAGNCKGHQFTAKSIKKMSESHMGKSVPIITREKISKTWGERANKTYILISPENKIMIFRNIRKFCRENVLDNVAIGLLLKDKIHYYKGWIRDYSHTYSFINPDGIVYNNIVNLTKFCNEHNLKMKGMSKLYCGTVKSYFKWRKNINK
jgi:hypothetical protein